MVGDWNGDGRDDLGLFRLGFFWILDYNGNGVIDSVNLATGDKAFAFGGLPGDIPVVGDWNGDGRSKPGSAIDLTVTVSGLTSQPVTIGVR